MSSSIVSDFSISRKQSCGYCGSRDRGFNHGMIAHRLTIDDYQSLIDRGWRRSGIYCYKPILIDTCCPAYTIKCNAINFKSSKSQKKIFRKFNNFLTKSTNVNLDASDSDDDTEGTTSKEVIKYTVLQNQADQGTHTKTPEGSTSELVRKRNCDNTDNESKLVKKGIGPDPNRLPCKKAKQLRLEKKQKKNEAKGIDISKAMEISHNQSKEKSFEDFINELPKYAQKKLEIKTIKPVDTCSEWINSETAAHKLYMKYQVKIHGDTPEKCRKEQYLRFLVDTPLKSETRNSIEYGTYHQQYWLDDKLIAVGVIDILPKCVSSVYFYYDPDYNKLSLGTYAALREIAFTRSLQKINAELQYYYMGFYIHSCDKMKYKAKFFPSYLLCPETYYWFSIEDCIKKLNDQPYSRFNDDQNAIDKDIFVKEDINDIFIYIKRNCIRPFSEIKFFILDHTILSGEENRLFDYGKLAGKTCAKRIIMAL